MAILTIPFRRAFLIDVVKIPELSFREPSLPLGK